MKLSNTFIGRQAEISACHELKLMGFRIIEKNWRRPDCEIDIIARKRKVMYFFEVKYRHNYNQGSGLEYITTSKQKQMAFAARTYIGQNNLKLEYCLGAIEVVGKNFVVSQIIESID